MTEYDLGNIEEIDGFDKYINKELKEKEKEIRKLERENRRLRLIVRLQKDIIENYQEISELTNKVVFE